MGSWRQKTLFFIFTISLLSCGRENGLGLKNKDIFIKPNLNYQRKMTNEEMNIALRICYALKTKRIHYKANRNGQRLNYSREEKKCGQVEELSKFSTVLLVPNNGPMIYQSEDNGFFIKEVPTDLNFPLGPICNKLFKGEKMEIVHQVSDLSKLQYEFKSRDGKDLVYMYYGIQDLKNKALDGYSTTHVDVYEFEVFPSSIHLTGVVVDHYKTSFCDESKEAQKQISIKLNSHF